MKGLPHPERVPIGPKDVDPFYANTPLYFIPSRRCIWIAVMPIGASA
jgi:hypothetical protein